MRCAACAADRPASAFSASQRKQTAARRRCIECVEGDRQPHTQPAQTQPAQTQPAQTQPAPQSALPEAGSAGALALPAAASSPFALAAAHALAPGMSWPHAVTYRGVPPLYPAPALWVRDIPGFLAELPAGLRRPQLRLMLQAYQNQFELDERFALLQWAYAQLPGGAATPRPHALHAELFDGAGLTLHVRDTGLDVAATALFGMLPGGYAVNTRVKLQAAAQRFCDKCKRPAAARCRCGEAYCSRDCQIAHWRDHRQICEFINAQFEMGIAYNEVFWAMRGVGKCQDRC
jgi:hypothetical protein